MCWWWWYACRFRLFWILGSVLDSRKCFGFWEVFCPFGPLYISVLSVSSRNVSSALLRQAQRKFLSFFVVVVVCLFVFNASRDFQSICTQLNATATATTTNVVILVRGVVPPRRCPCYNSPTAQKHPMSIWCSFWKITNHDGFQQAQVNQFFHTLCQGTSATLAKIFARVVVSICQKHKLVILRNVAYSITSTTATTLAGIHWDREKLRHKIQRA